MLAFLCGIYLALLNAPTEKAHELDVSKTSSVPPALPYSDAIGAERKHVHTIGIIVAGGKSRRMGSDKAAILYKNKSLLDHAIDLLALFGVKETIVLGRPGHAHGVADPLLGAGPAANIVAWINGLYQSGSKSARTREPLRLVILPVDMPLLSIEQLQVLNKHKKGGYFDDLYLPLVATVDRPISCSGPRMKDLLAALKIEPVTAPTTWQPALKNFNSIADLEALN